MRTDQQPLRIALFAPSGRMGRAIHLAIVEDPTFELTNDTGDVLVDFSAPDALRASLDRALSAGVPILVGTTGLGPEHDAMIDEAARTIPVLKAPNTSLGVALLADLTQRAARVLGPEQWDIEIIEAHHKRKADAPSGTALHLGASAEGPGAVRPPSAVATGRAQTSEGRAASAIRGGPSPATMRMSAA